VPCRPERAQMNTVDFEAMKFANSSGAIHRPDLRSQLSVESIFGIYSQPSLLLCIRTVYLRAIMPRYQEQA